VHNEEIGSKKLKRPKKLLEARRRATRTPTIAVDSSPDNAAAVSLLKVDGFVT
jgi:hypothetical protein